MQNKNSDDENKNSDDGDISDKLEQKKYLHKVYSEKSLKCIIQLQRKRSLTVSFAEDKNKIKK